MIALGVPMALAARAWRAYSDWTDRKTCQLAGCDWRWYAADDDSGVPVRVCARCHEESRP